MGSRELPKTVRMIHTNWFKVRYADFPVISISSKYITLHNPEHVAGATTRYRLDNGYEAGVSPPGLSWYIPHKALPELRALAPSSTRSRKHKGETMDSKLRTEPPFRGQEAFKARKVGSRSVWWVNSRFGWDAVLLNSRKQSVNAINYGLKVRPTTVETDDAVARLVTAAPSKRKHRS